MSCELGYRSDAIERQLAHKERNKVRASYNQAEYLEDRIQMMQAWADLIDTLREGEGKVVGCSSFETTRSISKPYLRSCFHRIAALIVFYGRPSRYPDRHWI